MNKMYYNNNAVGIVNHGSVDNQALIGLIQRSATSVDIPVGTTSIGDYAFMACRSLTSIDIPSGVTSIGYCAFNDCAGLTSIVIPNSVISIGGQAFAICGRLTSVIIGNGVTSIGGSAFWGCSRLTSVTCNAVTPPTLETGAFQNTPIASGKGYIYVSSSSIDAYKAANNWSTYASQIIEIPT